MASDTSDLSRARVMAPAEEIMRRFKRVVDDHHIEVGLYAPIARELGMRRVSLMGALLMVRFAVEQYVQDLPPITAIQVRELMPDLLGELIDTTVTRDAITAAIRIILIEEQRTTLSGA